MTFNHDGDCSMCLSTAALSLFLNLLNLENITTEPGRVIIHASDREAHWVNDGDRWCTMAPQLDRLARFAPSATE